MNTAKKTFYDIQLLSAFIKETTPDYADIPPENLPPEILDNLISKFIMTIKKRNGEEYEPVSLRSFFSSFQRHNLLHKNYNINILTDPRFSKARKTLSAKQKSLKRDGKGNTPNKAAGLTEEEIDTLYQQGVMGLTNPEAMLNTLWFNNTTHFGLRGVTAHRAMCWGDVTLQKDSFGNEYLQ